MERPPVEDDVVQLNPIQTAAEAALGFHLACSLFQLLDLDVETKKDLLAGAVKAASRNRPGLDGPIRICADALLAALEGRPDPTVQ